MNKIELRYYQREAVDAVFKYFQHSTGNPLVVLPTGAGKSLTMAAFIYEAIQAYPATRVLLLTHVKELIEQDAQAIINYWHEAPVGIWSASVGQKQKQQITVAGIQSIHRLPAKFADTDLIIVDEAHLIPRSGGTMYRKFLDALLKYNPAVKVIGLTATEYRTDSGLLVEGDERVFTDVAYSINVGRLIKEGYLCPLVMKGGATKADLSNVHVRGNEYIPAEAQKAMDHDHLIEGALNEVAQFAADRKHILGFCAGVEHAYHCMQKARARGWKAGYVHGAMSSTERETELKRFQSGEYRFMFNANILTVGYDFSAIDCIIMLRPTKSTGLYVQIMGRGLRKHKDKENTLVLDFVGAVATHGPIDAIVVKSKRKKGEATIGVAPVKECPKCNELIHASVMLCPGCGHEFPASAVHGTEAADGVIVAALAKPQLYKVDSVNYCLHMKDGRKSLKVEYWCGLKTFTEFLPVEDPRSFVRKHAVAFFWKRGCTCPDSVDEALKMSDDKRIPATKSVTVKMEGKYFRVIDAEIEFESMEATA